MGCWEPRTLGWTGVSDWSQYLQLLEAQPSQLQRLAPRAQSAPLLSTPLFRLPLQLLLCYLQHQGLRIRRRDRSPPGWTGERGEDRARRPPQPPSRCGTVLTASSIKVCLLGEDSPGGCKMCVDILALSVESS